MADPTSRGASSYLDRENAAMVDAAAANDREGLPPIQLGAGDGAAMQRSRRLLAQRCPMRA
jgi:hypothetical protein